MPAQRLLILPALLALLVVGLVPTASVNASDVPIHTGVRAQSSAAVTGVVHPAGLPAVVQQATVRLPRVVDLTDTGTWMADSGRWWWRNNDGSYPVSQWVRINGATYYFDGAGYMYTGWKASGGSWYYLDPSTGAMRTGTLTMADGTYNLSASGAMTTGWFQHSDGWRYYLPSGRQTTGWVSAGGSWYYLDPATAVMRTGTLTMADGTYFLLTSGVMTTGWFQHSDGWRYYLPSGRQATGWIEDQGSWYYLDPTTGLWTPGAQPAEGVFKAGTIISDQEFFNPGSMTTTQIRNFLSEKNPSCRTADDGTPCLKDYRTTTATLTSSFCSPYQGAANEDVAIIISKVSTACGINPRVILVLLQKEQSLVTASGNTLTPTRYTKATGFRCPDSSPCDPTYAGFASQIYYAASRLVQYGEQPDSFRFRAGGTYWIAYHPAAGCGSAQVTITNRATAALYNYTPYQPNAAALANLSGSGDSCSSYGNRNFWRIYRTWFGSTGV